MYSPEIQAALEANTDLPEVEVLLIYNLRAAIQKRYLGEVTLFCEKCKLPMLPDDHEGWASCCGTGIQADFGDMT